MAANRGSITCTAWPPSLFSGTLPRSYGNGHRPTSDLIMTSGRHNDYYWIEWHGAMLYTLLDRLPDIVLDRYLINTSFEAAGSPFPTTSASRDGIPTDGSHIAHVSMMSSRSRTMSSTSGSYSPTPQNSTRGNRSSTMPNSLSLTLDMTMMKSERSCGGGWRMFVRSRI